MLSLKKIKFIKSLNNKKQRDTHNCFIVEGEKIVLELIDSNLNIVDIFAIDEFINNNKADITKLPITKIDERELKKISSLKTPNKVVAIAEMPNKSVTNKNSISDLTIVLDNIQDPGNLGTIIRTANWFGVNNIFCSQNTVDSYNQKVIQSTMGAIFRVNIFYTDIALFIKEAIADKKEIYGALLSGTNIYKSTLNNDGIIVLGNESKGISTPIQELISNRIKIPNYPENTNSMESLNVSIACGIILSEFRRQNS